MQHRHALTQIKASQRELKTRRESREVVIAESQTGMFCRFESLLTEP